MKKPKFDAFSYTLENFSGRRMVLFFRTKYGKGSVYLSAGCGDKVVIRRIKDTIYVLALNTRLPYVGLEVFELLRAYEKGDEKIRGVGDVFLQEGACEESLGKGWEDLEDWELIGILEEYL